MMRLLPFHIAAAALLLFPAAAGAPGPGAAGTPPPAAHASFDSIRTNLGDYIWPTDASTKVTSSFAEYRSMHFHGGIDISTNGSTGHSVFAARDGYVARIRITPNGYGKMLYVRHADGYVSTYAHLLSFSPAIERAARQEQLRKGAYTIDAQFDSAALPVQKGEVIALSGESGFGPPHLHFELRDENLNPVNPMLCTNFAVRDRIAPSIRRLMISPLTPLSSVDNGGSSRFFSRFPRSKTGLRIPQPVRIHGDIGVSVEANDRSDGTASRSGVHRMELSIDDSLAFVLQLDRIPVQETKLIDLHYDLPELMRGRGRFQKLYLERGNTLPLYRGFPEGAGVIRTDNLPEGTHTFLITCSDIGGNESQLRGTFTVNRTPVISILRVEDDEIVLAGENLSSVVTCTVMGKKLRDRNWPSVHTLGSRRFERDATGIELPVHTSAYDVIRVTAVSESGGQSQPAVYYRKKPAPAGHELFVAVEARTYDVRITATTTGLFTGKIAATLSGPGSTASLPLGLSDLSTASGVFAPGDSMPEPQRVKVSAEVDGEMLSATREIDAFALSPLRGGAFASADGSLRVRYAPGAVFRPMFVRLKGEGARYELSPGDVLLNGGLTCTAAIPPGEAREHLGLYYRSDRGWIFQTATPDSGAGTFTTTLDRTLGEVAVMRDAEPPTIGSLRVFPRGGSVSVGFRYRDNLSGIDPDELAMTIDDERVIPEIDGEHRRVWYRADPPLPPGRHTIRIELRDRQGNLAAASRAFTVRRR